MLSSLWRFKTVRNAKLLGGGLVVSVCNPRVRLTVRATRNLADGIFVIVEGPRIWQPLARRLRVERHGEDLWVSLGRPVGGEMVSSSFSKQHHLRMPMHGPRLRFSIEIRVPVGTIVTIPKSPKSN